MDAGELYAAIREKLGDRQGEIMAHLEHLVEGQKETNDRLRIMNGRVSKAEINIAVLQDRAEEAKSEARKTGSIFGILGVILGGALIKLGEHFFGQ